ncbi:MAG: trypsin-like peptidase domain-containing protein [Gemmatimonadota bacterium]
MNRYRTDAETIGMSLPWSQVPLLLQLIGLGVLLSLGGQYGALALLLPVVRMQWSGVWTAWRRAASEWPPLPLPARRVAILLLIALALVVARVEGQAPAHGKHAVESCQDSLPVIYDRIAPAVVSIGAMSIDPYDVDHRLDRVTGSGLIVDSTGLILTNSHVVFGRQVITVTLDEGETVRATLIGADPIFDIALLRIPPPDSGQFPVAPLSDRGDLRIGAEVYAIGNPLGLNQTLTRGIVSATDRLLPGSGWSLTEPLIQTDAAINPGSSGGPLVDRCGRVVGITTAMLQEAQNIGFAVPIQLARAVIPELLAQGHVGRPWLGVQGQFVMPVLKELLRLPLVDGLLVEALDPGSPAERAGLRGGFCELSMNGHPVLLGGDIITQVNGIRLDSAASLTSVLSEIKVGSMLHLTLMRAGQELSQDVSVAERPSRMSDQGARRASAAKGEVVGAGWTTGF